MGWILFIVFFIVFIIFLILLNSNKQNDVDIKIQKGSEEKEYKINKSGKTKGQFDVSGYNHLPEETKTIIRKNLKEGDILNLIPDTKNTYDKTAIKVVFNNTQVGWVSRNYNRKKFLFDSLINGENIKTICLENHSYNDVTRARRPDSDGNWNDIYHGVKNKIIGKFELTYK